MTGKALAALAFIAGGSALADQPKAKCSSPPAELSQTAGDWNGWGSNAANSRYQSDPGLELADVPKLRLKWAFAFPNVNTMTAQPAVVSGRVFIGSADGTVYSLDAASGCVYWTYSAGAPVRGAISLGRLGSGRWAAFFGDLHAFAHAVDANTGTPLWKTKIDEHRAALVTGSVAFTNGRVYVPVSSTEETFANNPSYPCCTFRGSLAALDAETGTRIWQTYTVTEPAKPYALSRKSVDLSGPAGAAIWSAPTIDTERKLVFVATGNSYTSISVPASDAVVAISLDTGKIQWIAQTRPDDNFIVGCPLHPNCPKNPGDDLDFGASPVLQRLPDGKQVLLAGQKSGVVYALDPDDRGRILWQKRIGAGGPMGGVVWGLTTDGKNVYAAVADWLSEGTGSPGLSALDLVTGKRTWFVPAPAVTGIAAQSAAVTAMPGAVFSGTVDGHLRAYSADTGKVLWNFDTNRSFETVNGVPGSGGSLDGPGAVIAEGLVLTVSGFSGHGGDRGNVLLVFSQ